MCNAAISQHELYSRAMQERRPHPSHCMSISITSASMFVESLREMQGNVTRAGTHAAAVGILGSVAESLASRTVSGSDMMSMLSFERSDRDVVVTIADSAESQQTGEISEGVVRDAVDAPSVPCMKYGHATYLPNGRGAVLPESRVKFYRYTR